MKRYAIYQLSDDNEKIRDLYFMSTEEIQTISDEYDLVGLVSAHSFDQVFGIGNMQRSRIELVSNDMRSVSVGDIIEDMSTGETVVVASIGFNRIQMKEAA